jgi:exonuclease SbcC
MRLIRLKIRNIASLKSEHEIDFSQILHGSALFAITGETGSGKSSILNSIGLALYGEIYKKNINQVDVVTLGEKEGFIELIFQVKGKYYLADWRARVLKQNGEPYSTPQSPTRNLYKLDGKEFDSPKVITTESCAELLNLNFDQFCRCIILNQGEFAKFLNSSFKDRRDILEKLYPGEMLDNISKELETEKKALEKSKHDLEIELHTLRGDNISGDALKNQKEELERQLKALENDSQQIEKLDYHFVSLLNYHDKFNDNEQKKARIKADMAIETTKYNHLLKASEEIQEQYLLAKKNQETQLPLLQTYLKKEETLKLLEEGWNGLKKRSEEILRNLNLINEKILSIGEQEKHSQDKFKTAASQLKLPLEKLKSAREHFEGLFEHFTEKELLQEELKGKLERLGHLEMSGKEIKLDYDTKEKALSEIPSNIKDLQIELERSKTELSLRIDKKQRAEIKSQELKNHIQGLQENLSSLQKKIDALGIMISKTSQDLFPLEATLKLQEVLNATAICVDHAMSSGLKDCPICEQKVPDALWGEIKDKLAATDLAAIRKQFEDGNKLIFQGKKEQELYQNKLSEEKMTLKDKEQEWTELAPVRDEILPTLAEIDQKLILTQKKSWDFDKLTQEVAAKKIELHKTREQYGVIKSEVSGRQVRLIQKESSLETLGTKLQDIIPVINRDAIRDLKIEVRLLNQCLELEANLEKVQQERNHQLELQRKAESETKILQGEEALQLKKIEELKTELSVALKDQKASDLISQLTETYKVASSKWTEQVEAQKKQELILKDSQGRLYQLDELTKDYDLHFSKELHTVRELSIVKIKIERPELLEKLQKLDLNFTSPRELFIPLKDLIQAEKENFKQKTNQCRMSYASAATRLSDWEKLQDKILLLELKAQDIQDALARKMRLFEVLGRDELRTFVLSLVEENLIHQTNDELQKLCQGRYEIVHQVRSLKMTPEFFILDKFREGGRRKVSTLSGGETFMVSLAMALGLAEMTRGQAEIDSLFIDEGFGTLDQESLEDVLDMLKQIQTRGLMVGIISHIKTLTNALPVNLVLNKKQDGTSHVSVVYN